MNILVIDNHIDHESWGAEEIVQLVHKSSSAVLTSVRRAPHQDLPKNLSRWDRVIISGSKTSATDQSHWVLQLDQAIKTLADLKKPTLGICYGHQSMVRALSGLKFVGDQTTQEFGWGAVTLTSHGKSSALFRNLPESFTTFHWHRDEVVQLPPDTVHLASSTHSSIQAIQWKNLPFFSVQFHPERTWDAGNRILEIRRKADPKLQLLNEAPSKILYNPEIGLQLVKNFLQFGATHE